MENQHRKIRGYRELNETEIDLMNEIKVEGERIQQLIVKVSQHLAAQSGDIMPAGDAHRDRHVVAKPARWLAMARSELQTGLMKLVRSVAQPTNF